jgi:hypothetical protein
MLFEFEFEKMAGDHETTFGETRDALLRIDRFEYLNFDLKAEPSSQRS